MGSHKFVKKIPIWFDIAGGVEDTSAYNKSVSCEKQFTYPMQLEKTIVLVFLENENQLDSSFDIFFYNILNKLLRKTKTTILMSLKLSRVLKVVDLLILTLNFLAYQKEEFRVKAAMTAHFSQLLTVMITKEILVSKNNMLANMLLNTKDNLIVMNSADSKSKEHRIWTMQQMTFTWKMLMIHRVKTINDLY